MNNEELLDEFYKELSSCAYDADIMVPPWSQCVIDWDDVGEIYKHMKEKIKNNWISEMLAKPDIHKWVIVRDDEGNEYPNHQWNGTCWYEYIVDEDGSADGWRSNVDVISWKYDKNI